MGKTAVVLTVVTLLGCGEDLQPVIRKVSPLNGATGVDTIQQPVVKVASNISVDPYDRKIVLHDVTGGARKTVPGIVEVEGTTITYQPKAALEAGHRYQLELTGASIVGTDGITQVDGSEAPHEPLSWPFRLEFQPGSAPKVRAAYLESGPSILVRFSQPMNAAVTEKQIQVLDLGGKPLSIKTPAWLDDQSVRVDLGGALDPVGLYTLSVARDAAGQDGILLDGDDDGNPGEANDSFSVQFTGSQKVILSRLK